MSPVVKLKLKSQNEEFKLKRSFFLTSCHHSLENCSIPKCCMDAELSTPKCCMDAILFQKMVKWWSNFLNLLYKFSWAWVWTNQSPVCARLPSCNLPRARCLEPLLPSASAFCAMWLLPSVKNSMKQYFLFFLKNYFLFKRLPTRTKLPTTFLLSLKQTCFGLLGCLDSIYLINTIPNVTCLFLIQPKLLYLWWPP